MGQLSRRSVLGGIAATGAALAFDLRWLVAHAQGVAEGGPAYFFLSNDEAAVLTALADRLIPRDEWPSASEAGVIDYIDFQLATAWGEGAGLYRQGPFHEGTPGQGYQLPYTPAELYRKALVGLIETDASRVPALSDGDKDALLTRLEKDEMALNGVPGKAFFAMLRQNVVEGYLADPVYNGNRDYAGWNMLGFPGADAYYLTEVDRYNMVYWRAPSGIAHRPDIGTPRFTALQAAGG